MESKGVSDVDVNLRSYLDRVAIVLRNINNYLDLTKDYLRASHEAEYDYMVGVATKLNQMTKIAQRVLTEHTLQDICELYEIHAALAVFEQSQMASSMSTGNVRDLQAAIKDGMIELHEDPCNSALCLHLTKEEVPTYYKIIEASTATTAPILQLIEFCIDKVTFAQRVRLEQLLEAKKDAVLNVTTKFLPCGFPATQSFLCKNGLCSQTAPLDPVALFAFLGYKYSVKKSWPENLAKLDCNVVVIDNQVGTPMTFQLRTLLDEDYIKTAKLIVAPNAGVTGVTIKKMRTITVGSSQPTSDDRIHSAHSAHNVHKTHGAPPTKYEKNPALSWLVLDTLDGATYRVLGKSNVMVDSSEIRALLQGCPMRPAKYQELMGDIIVQAAYKPDLSIMCDMFAKRPTLKFSADLVRKKSLEKQLEFFAGRYSKLAAGEEFIWDPWAIMATTREIITQPEIYEIIMENISELYQITSDTDTEDALHRLTQYDIMSRLFYQEFDKRFDVDRGKLIDELTLALDYPGGPNSKIAATLTILQRKLRDVLSLSADKLDSLHLWTEYGVSLKKFVA